MSRLVVGVSLGSVLLVALLLWVTWACVFTPVDRVFVAMLFGVGGAGGQ